MKRIDIANLTLIPLFAALTAILSQIAVPTPFIPFTLSLCAVFLAGGILGYKSAPSAMIVYMLIGAVGIPVFTGFKGGLAVLAGPTGGYLWSYPIMAFIIAFFRKKFKTHKAFAMISGMAASLAVCYTLGTIQFMLYTNGTFIECLMTAVVPFIFFDILKIALSSAVCLALDKIPVIAKISDRS